MGLSHGVQLDPHHVAGSGELAPGVGAAVGSRELRHPFADHLPDRFALKLAGDDGDRVPYCDHAPAIESGHGELAGIGLRGNLRPKLRRGQSGAERLHTMSSGGWHEVTPAHKVSNARGDSNLYWLAGLGMIL